MEAWIALTNGIGWTDAKVLKPVDGYRDSRVAATERRHHPTTVPDVGTE